MRLRAYPLFLTALGAGAPALAAQKPVLSLPPATGTSIVMTLSMPEGERESVHSVEQASAAGLRWAWRLVEVSVGGDTTRQRFDYSELAADMAGAMRYWGFHSKEGRGEHPGYTMHSVSRAVYRKLRAAGSDSFQVMLIEGAKGFAGFSLARNTVPVRWSGRLHTETPNPVPFPVLLNGERVNLPALRLRGRFNARGETFAPELWVLADSAYPMLLKWVGAPGEPDNVLQLVRIDQPAGLDATAAESLEHKLESTCRAELPGIYFAFNSALLDSTSDRTLASVAAILKRNASWKVTLEGHTDSIGTAAANRTLSERRVAAVRERLVRVFGIDGARLVATGFGSARPRESNGTIEGRARNRRVEMARECARS